MLRLASARLPVWLKRMWDDGWGAAIPSASDLHITLVSDLATWLQAIPQNELKYLDIFFPHCHLSKKELSDKESWAPRKCMNSQVVSAPFLRQLMMRKCSPCPSCEGMVPELEERLAPKTSFSISFPILRFYHFCRPHSEKWKDKSCIWKPHRITIYQKKKKRLSPQDSKLLHEVIEVNYSLNRVQYKPEKIHCKKHLGRMTPHFLE